MLIFFSLSLSIIFCFLKRHRKLLRVPVVTLEISHLTAWLFLKLAAAILRARTFAQSHTCPRIS